MKTKEKAVRLIGTFVLMVVLMFGVAPQGTSAADLAEPDAPTPNYDFGDLPSDPNAGSTPDYGITYLVDDGARHGIGNLFLGASIDAEDDGQPLPLANGDDADANGDDEDGVWRELSAPDFWTKGQGEVKVNVTGSFGCLMGWMDFWNSGGGFVGVDGDFDDSGTNSRTGEAWSEVIIDNRFVQAGDNYITFALPDDAATYPLFARFRLVPVTEGFNIGTMQCNQTAVGLTGSVGNGEVEDYYWNFKPSAVTLQGFSAASSTDDNSMLLVLSVMGLGSLTLLWIARRRRMQS